LLQQISRRKADARHYAKGKPLGTRGEEQGEEECPSNRAEIAFTACIAITRLRHPKCPLQCEGSPDREANRNDGEPLRDRNAARYTSNQGFGSETTGGPSVTVRNAGRFGPVADEGAASKFENVTDKIKTSNAATYFGAKKTRRALLRAVW